MAAAFFGSGQASTSGSPAIDGIALPGMPPGSPGMPGIKAAPFEALAIVDGVRRASDPSATLELVLRAEQT